MKVFVTGASGFVGLNIVDALIREGHEAHAYVRQSSNTRYLQQFDAVIHHGELSDRQTLTQAMKGMDGVIHCAGNTSTYFHDFPKLHATNVVGTQNVVDAAVANGVKRLVYTSTTSTIGAKNGKHFSATEQTPLEGYRRNSPYSITKRQAEAIVLGAKDRGLESIILNPAEVVGAYDHNFQWGRMVLAVSANQVPFLPPGSASFCSAREVGLAHVRALTLGEPYSRYILGGCDVSFKEFLQTIAEVANVNPDIPSTPYWWLRLRAKATESVYRFTKKLPMLDSYRMRVLNGHYFFSAEKANRDLGYNNGNLRQMIAECFDWYRNNRFI